MNVNMGVVIGGPAIAAVVIAGGLTWATNLVAETAASQRKAELLARPCVKALPREALRQPPAPAGVAASPPACLPQAEAGRES